MFVTVAVGMAVTGPPRTDPCPRRHRTRFLLRICHPRVAGVETRGHKRREGKTLRFVSFARSRTPCGRRYTRFKP